MNHILICLLTLLFSLSGPAMGENSDYYRCLLAAESSVEAGQGLANPFAGKSATEIDAMFTEKGFQPRVIGS